MGSVRWMKSSRCDNASCVEVARIGEDVGIRDSKLAGGPILTFSRSQWSSFVAGVRAGDFD
jgi:hypothetical protein